MKRVCLVKVLRSNSVFLVVLLLLGRKTKKKSLKLFRFITETTKSENWNIRKVRWSLPGNNIPINGPILLEKAHEFGNCFNYNDFTASNGWLFERMLFLSCTILYIVKKHPCLFFSKFGRNNLNPYNSKTHVIWTNFESPWGFKLYEFNCKYIILIG